MTSQLMDGEEPPQPREYLGPYSPEYYSDLPLVPMPTETSPEEPQPDFSVLCQDKKKSLKALKILGLLCKNVNFCRATEDKVVKGVLEEILVMCRPRRRRGRS